MASKKISLLDASGMLTREALLGYVYGGLPADAHAELEQLLAQNEMLADMVEGVRLIPTRVEAEKALYEVNADVAARSGSEASVPGIGENVSDFFWTYRRVAAVVGGLLLLSAVVLTFALLNVSNGDNKMTLNEETPQQTETDETEKTEMKVPALGETPSSISRDTTLTIAALDENKNRDAEFSEKDIDAVMQTDGAIPGLSAGRSSVENKKNEAREKEKAKEDKKQPEIVAAQAERMDTVVNQNMARADDAGLDKAREENEDLKKKEEKYLAEETILQSKQGTLSNTSSTSDSYFKNLPLTTAEQMPAFPGGDVAFIQYLNNNLKYPQKSKADGVEGKVYVSFVIGTAGKVKEIAVIQGVNKEINAEAIRLIAAMPKWEPGKQGGKAVMVQLYRTIEFKL